ncbi:unnamed protein product [Symbiodinium sp. CCMP2592]|nr:unnamed protein product [Symbiodinium sp. CCMP2592]
MLDALRGLMACDLGEGLDQKDAELIEALGPAAEGPSEIPSSWRQEAKILAWPILPWMAALQQASSSSAALIADQLLRPLLADLARHGNVPAELKSQLAEVFFPRRKDADAAAHARCLRLALECVPQEFGLAATERAHEVVQELLGLLLEAEDAGDASCGPAPLLDDAVAALTLAFRAPARGGLAFETDGRAWIAWAFELHSELMMRWSAVARQA